jgi:K+-sensing histidine kinase KdpD
VKENKKNTSEYIQELEDRIVDLSLQLKGKDNVSHALQTAHYERIRKLVHNLKNPIGVVYSFSEIMAETNENSFSEKEKKYIQAIKNSAAFSLETLNGLAKINSLNSPKFKLKTERIDYTALVKSSLNKFANEAKEKQISIIEKLAEKPIFITIDGDQIQQVIALILQNALRFSANNTTITISIHEKQGVLETVIIDEGIGIAEEDLHTIFDEFSVVNTYSNDNQKCVGLGLAIAKKIIELHKGSLSIQSTIQKGSRFSFSIPV